MGEVNIYEEMNRYYQVYLLVHAGNVDDLKKFIEEEKIDITEYIDKSLELACSFNRLEMVDYLISNGADIHFSNDFALRYMTRIGNFDWVKKLVKMGANVTAWDNEPIKTAVRNGYIDIAKFLIDNGADINACNNACSFYNIVKNRDNEFVKFVLNKIRKNVTLYKDIASIAIGVNNIEILKFLIEDKGIDLNSDSIFSTISIKNPEDPIFKYVISKVTDTKTLNQMLIKSAANGNCKSIRFFIAHGADVHAENDMPLLKAIENKKYRAVKCLLENKADVHAREKEFLMAAVRRNSLNIMKILVQYGADYRIDGDAVFIEACKKKRNDIAVYLLDIGADVHAQKDIALLESCSKGNAQLVAELIKRGADIHSRRYLGYAIRSRGYPLETVKCLVDNGVKITDKDLVLSSKYFCDGNITKLLVENGAYTEDLCVLEQWVRRSCFDLLEKMIEKSENLLLGQSKNEIFVLIKDKKIVVTPGGIKPFDTFIAEFFKTHDAIYGKPDFIKKWDKIININKYKKDFSEACKNNDSKEIRMALKYGFNVENEDLLQNLKYLMTANNVSLFEAIIERINPETFNSIKDELFIHSVDIENIWFIKYFVEKGVDLYSLNNEALYIAVLKEREDILEYFEKIDNSICYVKNKDVIALYVSNQDIVFTPYFEGSLEEFQKEDPVMYEKIINKLKAAI